MSFHDVGYDLFVYSVAGVSSEADLPVWRKWAGAPGRGWVAKEGGWQVVVNPSVPILGSDYPAIESLLKLHPDVQFVTAINLEGDPAPEAYATITLTALKLAKERVGAVVDWQTPALIVPLTAPRAARKRAPKRASEKGATP